ncbi:hypothetical protein [Gemmatimonas sp.]|uniref:hypothetical protein n=1 Tax=Gemmatimonas sp. TaxID=1962908 RepID=UPI0025C1A40B|nr:hypothetical protein [Gemmatimonas sp.]MCA2991169.1 hypothetical protein [Gemmatimonas sp.]
MPSAPALADATALVSQAGYGRLLALASLLGPATADELQGLLAWAIARRDLDIAWAVESALVARDVGVDWAVLLRSAGKSREATELSEANADPEAVRAVLEAVRDAGFARPALKLLSVAPGSRADEVADEGDAAFWEAVFTEAAQQRLAALPQAADRFLSVLQGADLVAVRDAAMDAGEAEAALLAETAGRWRVAECARRELSEAVTRNQLSVERVLRDLRRHDMETLVAQYARPEHRLLAFTLEVAVRHAVKIPPQRPHALLAMTEPAFAAALLERTVPWAATLDVETLHAARDAVLDASADVVRQAYMRGPTPTAASAALVQRETLWALAVATPSKHPPFPRLEPLPLSAAVADGPHSLLLERVRRTLAASTR